MTNLLWQHTKIGGFICVLFYTDLYILSSSVVLTPILQIVLLDQIPDVHMYVHLPEFLDGLFTILGDNNKEIRKM